jgi:hypothetical protein
LRLAEGRQKGQKVKQLARALRIPKIGKWSILGIATAISGKRQEMDSAIACPTPERLGGNNSIYELLYRSFDIIPLCPQCLPILLEQVVNKQSP